MKVNVLVFQEEDKFIAQGLEYDYVIQASTRENAMKRFFNNFKYQGALCLKYGVTPYWYFSPAPESAFDKASKSIMTVVGNTFKIKGEEYSLTYYLV